MSQRAGIRSCSASASRSFPRSRSATTLWASRCPFVIPAPDDSEIRKPNHVTGASTNAARSVSCSEICFPSGGETIAATWYRPDVLAAAVPCVVMGHGFTLTRRDGIPEYAQRLAAAGFAALAFDYRHWGDSTGNPRGWISLREQLADWQAAVRHARTLQGVDAGRIAVWGFSMGGGHALLTAARDTRIAATVALMPSTDPLAALPPVAVGLRMIGRALREVITRRTVTMPAPGPPGSFAVITRQRPNRIPPPPLTHPHQCDEVLNFGPAASPNSSARGPRVPRPIGLRRVRRRHRRRRLSPQPSAHTGPDLAQPCSWRDKQGRDPHAQHADYIAEPNTVPPSSPTSFTATNATEN